MGFIYPSTNPSVWVNNNCFFQKPCYFLQRGNENFAVKNRSEEGTRQFVSKKDKE